MAGKRDKGSRKGEKEMRILVLGIGNPILTDDAVGILVVRALGEVDADIREAPIGGFALLDLIRGYDKVIVVDAVRSEQERMPGTVSVLEENEIKRALHASSTHDVSFFEALELGKKLFSEEMPTEIVVVGIEVEDTKTFSEKPTECVQNAIPEAVDLVKALIETAKQRLQ
jgi:hydrogenase maturation protease